MNTDTNAEPTYMEQIAKSSPDIHSNNVAQRKAFIEKKKIDAGLLTKAHHSLIHLKEVVIIPT